MAKKNFDDVAENYFNEPELTKGFVKTKPKTAKSKKVRKTLSLSPLPYEDFQKIAHVDRTSVSELIDDFIVGFVEKNSAKLQEYENIMSKKN